MSGHDWRSGVHWNKGRRVPCVHCGRVTFLLDALGRPSHKTCADNHDRKATP